jgi:anti-sigma regulatory factor (Ser/Thr protein kinase)
VAAGDAEQELSSGPGAPKLARDAVVFVAGDLPEQIVQDARLLTSEMVTNSIKHGPTDVPAPVGLLVDVSCDRLRVEVSDFGSEVPTLRQPDDNGGYGLSLVDQLASRWDTSRTAGGNLTWFEFDLPNPGALPQRR